MVNSFMHISYLFPYWNLGHGEEMLDPDSLRTMGLGFCIQSLFLILALQTREMSKSFQHKVILATQYRAFSYGCCCILFWLSVKNLYFVLWKIFWFPIAGCKQVGFGSIYLTGLGPSGSGFWSRHDSKSGLPLLGSMAGQIVRFRSLLGLSQFRIPGQGSGPPWAHHHRVQSIGFWALENMSHHSLNMQYDQVFYR